MTVISIQAEDTAIETINEIRATSPTSPPSATSFWLSIYVADKVSAATDSTKSYHYTIAVTRASGSSAAIQLAPENVAHAASGTATISRDGGDSLLPPITLRLVDLDPGATQAHSTTLELDLHALLGHASLYRLAFPVLRTTPLVSAGALLDAPATAAPDLDFAPLAHRHTTLFDAVIDKYNAAALVSDLPAALRRALRARADDNTALALSPRGGLYVSGDARGRLLVGVAPAVAAADDDNVLNTLRPRRVLEPGHHAAVSRALFFPSAQVVLSAGRDMQVRLWSAVDGSNPRVFAGHTAAVTDLALALLPEEQRGSESGSTTTTTVAAGRNFVSAGGTDSTVRLWETGSSKLVHTFKLSPAGDDFTSLDDSDVSRVLIVPTAVLPRDTSAEEKDDDKRLDFETRGKAVVAVHHHPVKDTAYVAAYDLYSRARLFNVALPVSAPGTRVTAAAVVITANSDDGDRWLLLTGSSRGEVAVWDLRNLWVPVAPWTRVATSPTSAVTGLAVGTGAFPRITVLTPLSLVSVPLAALVEGTLWSGNESSSPVTFLAGFDAAAPTDAQYSADGVSQFVTGKQGLLYQYVV